MPTSDDARVWSVRAFVYQHFAETARPPTAAETAARFGLDEASAAALYAELHRRHALFLDLATGLIRMASPFSGVPTGYRVHARGRAYYANCAWDALGIPAALGAPAQVEAACAQTGEPIALGVPPPGTPWPEAEPRRALRTADTGHASLDPRHPTRPDTDASLGVSPLRIHFLVPFRHWYDDLVFT
jgi:hypothetical protein